MISAKDYNVMPVPTKEKFVAQLQEDGAMKCDAECLFGEKTYNYIMARSEYICKLDGATRAGYCTCTRQRINKMCDLLGWDNVKANDVEYVVQAES
jgi:hypothetical protein